MAGTLNKKQLDKLAGELKKYKDILSATKGSGTAGAPLSSISQKAKSSSGTGEDPLLKFLQATQASQAQRTQNPRQYYDAYNMALNAHANLPQQVQKRQEAEKQKQTQLQATQTAQDALWKRLAELNPEHPIIKRLQAPDADPAERRALADSIVYRDTELGKDASAKTAEMISRQAQRLKNKGIAPDEGTLADKLVPGRMSQAEAFGRATTENYLNDVLGRSPLVQHAMGFNPEAYPELWSDEYRQHYTAGQEKYGPAMMNRLAAKIREQEAAGTAYGKTDEDLAWEWFRKTPEAQEFIGRFGEETAKGAYVNDQTRHDRMMANWRQAMLAEGTTERDALTANDQANREAARTEWMAGDGARVEREIRDNAGQFLTNKVEQHRQDLTGAWYLDDYDDLIKRGEEIPEDIRERLIDDIVDLEMETEFGQLYADNKGVLSRSHQTRAAKAAETRNARQQYFAGSAAMTVQQIINMMGSTPADAVLKWNDTYRENQRQLEQARIDLAKGYSTTGEWVGDIQAYQDLRDTITVLENDQKILVGSACVMNEDFDRRNKPIKDYVLADPMYAAIAGMQFKTVEETDENGKKTQKLVRSFSPYAQSVIEQGMLNKEAEQGTTGARNIDFLNTLTPEQRDAFIYQYNTDESPDKHKAYEYLDAIGNYALFEAYGQRQEQEFKWASEHPVGAFFQDMFMNPARDIASFRYMWKGLTTRNPMGVSGYDPVLQPQTDTQAHREATEIAARTTGENVGEWTLGFLNTVTGGNVKLEKEEINRWRQAFGDVFSGGKTTLDMTADSGVHMLTGLGVGKAVTAAAGLAGIGLSEGALNIIGHSSMQIATIPQSMQAAATQTEQAKQSGYGDATAMTKGILAGAWEELTETIGMEWAVTKAAPLASKIASGSKFWAAMTAFALTGTAEGAEEVVAGLGYWIFENMINRSQSDWTEDKEKARAELIEEAESKGEARKEPTENQVWWRAFEKKAAEIGFEAVSAFFSAGATTGVSIGYSRLGGWMGAQHDMNSLQRRGIITPEESRVMRRVQQDGVAAMDRIERAHENNVDPIQADVDAVIAYADQLQELSLREQEQASDKAAEEEAARLGFASAEERQSPRQAEAEQAQQAQAEAEQTRAEAKQVREVAEQAQQELTAPETEETQQRAPEQPPAEKQKPRQAEAEQAQTWTAENQAELEKLNEQFNEIFALIGTQQELLQQATDEQNTEWQQGINAEIERLRGIGQNIYSRITELNNQKTAAQDAAREGTQAQAMPEGRVEGLPIDPQVEADIAKMNAEQQAQAEETKQEEDKPAEETKPAEQKQGDRAEPRAPVPHVIRAGENGPEVVPQGTNQGQMSMTMTVEELKNYYRIVQGLRTPGLTEEQRKELSDRGDVVMDARVTRNPYEAPAKMDGRQVTVTGIESTGTEATVKVQDGDETTTVPLKDVKLRGNMARIYEHAAAYKDLDTARLFLYGWQRSNTILPTTYIRAFEAIYTAGRLGNPLNALEQKVAEGLPAEVVESITKAGNRVLQQTETDMGVANEETQGTLRQTVDNIRNRTERQTGLVFDEDVDPEKIRAARLIDIVALDELANTLKTRLRIVNHIDIGTANLDLTQTDAETLEKLSILNASSHANAYFNPANGEIVVALDAMEGGLTTVATHEVWHYINELGRQAGEKGDTAFAQEVASFGTQLLKMARRSDRSFNLSRRVQQIIRQYESVNALGFQKHNTQEEKKAAAIEEIQANALFAISNRIMNQDIMDAQVQDLVQEHPNVIKKIRDAFRRWTRSMNKTIRTMADSFRETSAILQASEEDIEKLAQGFNRLVEMAGQRTYERKQGEEERRYSLDTQRAVEDANRAAEQAGMMSPAQFVYSLAGVQAQGRYGDIARQARLMSRTGMSDAEIIQKTGAVKGFRGNWWAVIDRDSFKLKTRWVMDQTDTDLREAGNFLDNVLDAPELFEAYPQLANARVNVRDNMGEENLGSMYSDDRTGEIVIELNGNMLDHRGGEEEMLDVLLHEIQHAIQSKEGTHRGANIATWQKIRNAYMARIRAVNQHMEEMRDKYGDEYLSAIPLTEDYALDTRQMSQAEVDQFNDQMDPIDFIQIRDDLLFQEKWNAIQDSSAFDLYRRTVGEIEARAQEQEGKWQRPDYRGALALEDYYDRDFGQVRYSLPGSEDSKYLIDQIREHSPEIEKLGIVGEVTTEIDLKPYYKKGARTRKAAIRMWAKDIADELQRRAYRDDLGQVQFSNASVSRGLSYIAQRNMAQVAALQLVPDVIRDGIVIEDRPNHKGRRIRSITYAARVKINNEPGEMGVIVHVDRGTNTYKTHKVILPDGSEFVLDENETEAGTHTEHFSETGAPAVHTTSVSDTIVSQGQEENNGQSGQSGVRHSMAAVDQDYLAAVESGDMETAGRMVEEAAKRAGYTLFGYHGTKQATLRYDAMGYGEETDYKNKRLPFTIFKAGQSGGIYVATNRSVSEGFAKNFRSDNPGTVMSLYVRFENPMVVNEHVWTSVPFYYNIPTPSIMREAGYTQADLSTEEISQFAQEHGYDGVIIEGIREGGDTQTDDIIAFRSDQIKLADPVVYDDAGQVIPLSQRFNPGQQDIRYSMADRAGETINSDQGKPLAQVLEGGSVARYSLASWSEKERKAVRKALVRAGFNERDVDKWIGDLDDVAAIIAADRVRLDYRADREKSAKKPNGDVYRWTIDFSTLCKKRLLFQGTRDAIQKLMPNTGLTAEDLIVLNNIMQEMGYEAPCSFCYVEGQRKHGGEFAEEFVRNYRKNHPGAKYIPTVWDVTSAEGLWKLQTEHPEVYRSFISSNNRRGVASTKPIQLRTDYRGEIRRMTKATVQYLNAHGGLRMQSFSDFETLHLIDMMQVVMDMAGKGLMSQAYTKVPNFAWVFGRTGIKINLSLVGAGTGVDAQGNLIFSDTEGMNFDKAMELRDAYSQNVGTILVGMNREHILAAMADSRIDFIIPFHRSGWSKDDMRLMQGMQHYDDFQDWQNEGHLVRNADGTFSRGTNVEHNLEPNGPEGYWDHHLSGKENAKRYLQMCADQGIVPKFEIFLHDNGDGSWSLQEDGSTDGYWKLLIDFKMYDNDGNNAPQQVVTPDFNMEQAQRVMDEYDGLGNGELPVAQKVVDRFMREYQGRHREDQRRYSMPGTEGQKARQDSRDSVAATVDESGETFYDDLGTREARYSLQVTDPKTLRMLDGQPHIVTYKTMKLLRGPDGEVRLLPPKATFAGRGQMEDYSVLGQWEQATEHPEWIKLDKKGNPTFDLVESGSKTTAARYNPYMHSSNLMINDQFSGAYQYGDEDSKLGRFVTVECWVPASEATSGYHAQYAKDSTGWHAWHTGTVAGAIRQAKGVERQVFLSRWIKPVRIVPDSEVAQHYRELIEGTDVSVPDNVVPPSLLQALREAGVPIRESGRLQDVRYSLDGVSETDPAMDRLMAENQQFRDLVAQMVSELNNQEQRATAQLTSKANMRRLARELKDRWQVDLPLGVMTENLSRIFTGLATARTPAEAQAAIRTLGDFARDAVMNAATTDRTDFDQYSEVRARIRSVRATAATVKEAYGDWESYKRNGYGRVKVVRTGENVDAVYQEIQDNWPGLIREGLTGLADQLNAMLDFLDATEIQTVNPYETDEAMASGYGVDQATRDLSMHLLRMFAEGGTEGQVEGVSSRRMGQLNGLLDRAEVVVADTNRQLTTAGYRGMTSREHNQQIAEIRQRLQQAQEAVQDRNQTIEQLEQQLQAAKRETQNAQEAVQVLRRRLQNEQAKLNDQEKQKLQQQIDDAEQKAKAAQRQADALQRRIDRRNQTEERNKVVREILRRKASLMKKLNSPNASGWVPVEMVEAVTELLQAVDTEGQISGTPNQPLSAQALQRAKAAYEAINKGTSNGQPGPMASYYNGDLAQTFDELSRTADGKRVRDLTTKELEQLRDIVAGYAAAVINEDRIFTQGRRDSLRAMGADMIEQAKNRIRARGEAKVQGKFGEWLSQATDRGLLKPVTVFERMKGTALGEIWQNALRPAEWKHIRHIQEAETFLNAALDQYHQHESVDRDGSRKQQRQRFTLTSGRTIELTDQELMTLYAWQKREAAMGTNHLLGGGIKLANPQRGATLQEYRLTPADLQAFNDALTDEQKAYVDHMVQYLSTTVGEWGNEVTRELYGIEKFREQYYLPFTVAQSYVAQQPATMQDQRIKTASFTRALTDKASTTLELRSFTEMWASHVEQMSDFNAFTLPIEDMVRLMNFKEGAYDPDGNYVGQGDNVRPLMERGWGSNTVGYIHDFLSRLNGNSRNERGGSWLNSMMGKAKGAAVTWNISVAFQQAGAGVRALAEMDPRDVLPALVTGIGRNGGFARNYAELQKYAPIAVEKAWGYFDTNMSRGLYQRAQTTWRSRLDDMGGWMAGKGDELNWSQIWDACKHEIRRLNPNMTDDEVKQHAADRFVEVIDRTQVVDSIFQRSAFATEKGMMRGLMSFMSEPVTMYNMIVRCVDEFQDAYRTNDSLGKRAAWGKAVRTGIGIILSAALTAFLKSLATGLRDRDNDKKDEDGKITGNRSYWDKVFDAWAPNFGENLMGLTTIFGNMYDNAVSQYGNGDLTTAWISNLYNAGKEILKGQDADWDKVAYRTTQALSNLTGIGFAGLYRDTKAIFMTVKETMDPESLSGTAWDSSQPWDVRLRAATKFYAYSSAGKKPGMKVKPNYYTDMLVEEYMANGMSEDFQKIADAAISVGATEKGLMSSFQTKLAKAEPKVKQAAQALADGDAETYDRLMMEIIKGGIGSKQAASMVKTEYNKIVKQPEEEPVEQTGEGLVEALKAEGSASTDPQKTRADSLLTTTATASDVKEAVKLYKAAGMTPDKIADKVEGKYKKPYIMASISGDTTEARRLGELLTAGGSTKDEMTMWTTEGIFSSTKDYGLYWMIKEGKTKEAKTTMQHLYKAYPGGQQAVKDRVLKWAKGLKAGSYDYKTVRDVLLAVGFSQATIDKTLKK